MHSFGIGIFSNVIFFFFFKERKVNFIFPLEQSKIRKSGKKTPGEMASSMGSCQQVRSNTIPSLPSPDSRSRTNSSGILFGIKTVIWRVY